MGGGEVGGLNIRFYLHQSVLLGVCIIVKLCNLSLTCIAKNCDTEINCIIESHSLCFTC